LGEYDVATKVGPIGVFHSSALPDAARYTLPELPNKFDARFNNHSDAAADGVER